MTRTQKIGAWTVSVGFTLLLALVTLAHVHAETASPAESAKPSLEESIRTSISKNILSEVTPSRLYHNADDWLLKETGYSFESIWGYIKTGLNFVFTKTIAICQKLLSYIE